MNIKIVLAICCVIITGCEKTEETSRIEMVKQEVAGRMKDPDSAKFRNLHYGYENLSGARKKSESVLCGEANGKNSFGGYVGYKNFIFHEGKLLFASGELGDKEKEILAGHFFNASISLPPEDTLENLVNKIGNDYGMDGEELSKEAVVYYGCKSD